MGISEGFVLLETSLPETEFVVRLTQFVSPGGSVITQVNGPESIATVSRCLHRPGQVHPGYYMKP